MAFDKVIDSAKLESEMKATANAIREKTGKGEKILWEENTGFAAAVNDISAGGGTSAFDIIARSVTEIESNAPSVGAYAFYNYTKLERAIFPEATTVDSYAFCNCTGLVDVSFPKTTFINQYGFSECDGLVSVEFPEVDDLEIYAFEGCASLEYCSCPKAARADNKVWYGCSSLKQLILPVITSMAIECASQCLNLEYVDLPKIKSFSRNCFSGDTKLATLIMRASSVASAAASNILSSTAIAAGTGYIYVPAAVVEKYKATANWAIYADQFRALEDYTVDGTVAGELDPNKIGGA